MSRYVRISEIARDLGCSSDTVLRLVRIGTIPGGDQLYTFEKRKGGRWVVDRAEYERWMQARAVRQLAANAANLAPRKKSGT